VSRSSTHGADNPQATVVADLADGHRLVSDAYDFAVFPAPVVTDEHLRPLDLLEVPEPADTLRDLLLSSNVVPAAGSNTLFRSDLLRQAGSFDTGLFALEDWDVHLRLAANCRWAAVPEPLVAYTLHAGAMSADDGLLRDQLLTLRERHPDLRPDPLPWGRWRATVCLHRGDWRAAGATYFRIAARLRDPRDLGRGLALLAGGGAVGRRVRRRAAGQVAAPAWSRS
jgi:hypothetical protein